MALFFRACSKSASLYSTPASLRVAACMDCADWKASSRSEGGAELKGLNQKTMHIFEPVQVASQVADLAPGQAAELDKLEPMGSGQSHCNTMSSTQVSSCIWSSSTGSLHTLHLLHELLHTRPAMIHRRAVLKRLATHAALPRPSGLTGLQVIA